MNIEEQLAAAQTKKTVGNMVGCGSCAGGILLPVAFLTSGNWAALTLVPVIWILALTLAIGGWVSASGRSREIAMLRRGIDPNAPMPSSSSAAAPVQVIPAESTEVKKPAARKTKTTPPVAPPPTSTMQDRLNKGKKAGL